MAIKPSIIVGLGNVGKRYARTRHNIGFEVIDAFAPVAVYRKEDNFIYFKKEEIIFVKPTTYMNLSGAAVLSAMNIFGVKKKELLVVCDDFSLPLGKIRIRAEGSSGGHNGLQSIIDAIGSDFSRLRIGIGPLPESALSSEFVLEKFAPEEVKAKAESLSLAVSIVDGLLTGGFPGSQTWSVS